MRYDKPTALLLELDGHGIYKAEILDVCDFDTTAVPVFNLAEVSEEIEARGLGGTLPEAENRLIYGWSTAEALAEHFLGENPTADFYGRGTKFRICFERLEKAGF